MPTKPQNQLITHSNLSDYDSVYQRVIDLFEGLSEEDHHKASAKLIFTLANHIGNENIIAEAITLTQQNTKDWQQEKG